MRTHLNRAFSEESLHHASRTTFPGVVLGVAETEKLHTQATVAQQIVAAVREP
jgi:hypothetical protein